MDNCKYKTIENISQFFFWDYLQTVIKYGLITSRGSS